MPIAAPSSTRRAMSSVTAAEITLRRIGRDMQVERYFGNILEVVEVQSAEDRALPGSLVRRQTRRARVWLLAALVARIHALDGQPARQRPHAGQISAGRSVLSRTSPTTA